MKKTFVMVMALMIVLSLGMVSAKTLIAGKIYNADFTEEVEGAMVTVSCSDGNSTAVANTTSLSDGSYAVEFLENGANACNDGYTLSVYASHPDFGFNTVSGVINNDVIGDWDIGLVNVPLVPEFGFIVGMLTLMSAVGIFFVVRRE